MRKTLTREMQNLVLGTRKSKFVAEQIGMPYPTLMRALNPYDQSCHLSCDKMHDILRVLSVDYGTDNQVTSGIDIICDMINGAIGVKKVGTIDD